MCFWGSGKSPSPPPAPAPAPMPTVGDTTPQISAEQRRRRIAALKYGAMSTIKTSGMGITGTGANLSTPAATGSKATLGA